MLLSRRRSWLALAVVFVACGGDGHREVDALLDTMDAATHEDSSSIADTSVDEETTSIDSDATSLDGDTSSGLTLEDFCDALRVAACAWDERCPGDFASCSDLSLYYTHGWAEACVFAKREVEAGRLRFDASVGARCLAAFEGECDFEGPLALTIQLDDGACRGLFRGAVPVGGACFYEATNLGGDECDEAYCRHGDGCPGTCTAWIAVGESCDDELDLRCDHLTSSCVGGRCVANLGEGAPCGDGAARCQWPLWCNELAAAPTCVRIRQEGEACAADAPCDYPSVCLAGHCALQVGHLDPCWRNPSCPEGDRCLRPDPATGMGVCDQPAGLGAPCDERGGDDACASPLVCVSVCQPLAAESEPCTFGDYGCQPGSWCDTSEADQGTCRALNVEGQDCGGFDGCAEGLFCMDDFACHPPGGVGEICYPNTIESCEPGLQCERSSSTCQPPGGLYDVCNHYFYASDCEPGLFCECLDEPGCDFNQASLQDPERLACVKTFADGDACAHAEQCASGFCGSNGFHDVCMSPLEVHRDLCPADPVDDE